MSLDKQDPVLRISCIDKRYDNLTSTYFDEIGLQNLYYESTAAGAALSLGYESCCNVYNKKCKCNPSDADMSLLREAMCKNLEIALTLEPIRKVYLVNHQDCGAIKAYLKNSRYPSKLGDNNDKEIKIHEHILRDAKKYMSSRFKDITCLLELIDINGTVARFSTKNNKWRLVHKGDGTNKKALWHTYFDNHD